MDKNSKTGGMTGSVTPSTALLNQRLAISPGPRMLDASEIKLLRLSKREIACQMRGYHGTKPLPLHPMRTKTDSGGGQTSDG